MKVDVEASFLRFVYPFLFDVDAYAPWVQSVEHAEWQGSDRPLLVWERENFPEEELLSCVARYLNAPEGEKSTVCLYKLGADALHSTRGLGGGPGSSVFWELVTAKSTIKFDFLSVHLALFQMGVGFLTIDADPGSYSDEIDQWLDFAHYYRFSHGQRGVSISAQRRIDFDQEKRQPILAPFFPDPAGGLEQHPEGAGTLKELIEALLSTVSPPRQKEKWWRDVFIPNQLLPYAGLFVDEVDEEEVSKLVYRARNFFRAGQEIQPTSEDLRADHRLLIQYADSLWFFFSLDGGGFIACNPLDTPFFRETLPDHLQNHYYLLFLLTLQQRFTLMKLTEMVASEWISDDRIAAEGEAQCIREEAFEQIRDQILLFTARGYFAQVMQREQHHRCYLKWQEIFQIERLYKEVSDDVRYMHSSLEAERECRRQMTEEAQRKRAESLETSINIIGAVIGVPALALSYLGAIGPVSPTVAFRVLVASLAAGLVLSMILNARANKAS